MPRALSVNPVHDYSQNWTIADGTSAISPTFDLGGATCVALVCDAALDSTSFAIHGNIGSGSTLLRCYNDSGGVLSVTVGTDRIVLFTPTDLIALRFVAFDPNAAQSGADSLVTLILRGL